MQVNMSLELKDVPGSLIKAIEPISSHGGNIVSVLHSRGDKDSVIVRIAFTVQDQSSLDIIKKTLELRRIRVKDINVEGKPYFMKKSLSFVLVGHVIDADIRDTIDKINELGLVSDIDIRMLDPEMKSSVLLHVVADKKRIGMLMETVHKICKDKDFLLIRSLE